MTVPTFLTGMAFGLLIAVAVYMAIDRISEAREAEERERMESMMRQRKLREEMNRPRDSQEQNIIEQARRGLQRREEG